MGNGGGGTENIADLQIATLKSKRVLPAESSAAQRCVYHPLVYRRTYAPFASAPAASGCRGSPLPRSFPGFSRARETGPPEANHRGKRNTSPARRPARMDHTRDNCISVRCVPSSGAPRQLSRCGSVRRGSDVPPARHSLPRPCFAAPGEAGVLAALR